MIPVRATEVEQREGSRWITDFKLVFIYSAEVEQREGSRWITDFKLVFIYSAEVEQREGSRWITDFKLVFMCYSCLSILSTLLGIRGVLLSPLF